MVDWRGLMMLFYESGQICLGPSIKKAKKKVWKIISQNDKIINLRLHNTCIILNNLLLHNYL